MRFALSIIKICPILNRIPEYHPLEEQLQIDLHNARQNHWLQWPGRNRRSGEQSVFLEGNGLLMSFHFLQTDLLLEAGILDDFVQCWSNSRVEQLKVWTRSSFDRTRRFQIIHCSTISTSLIHSIASVGICEEGHTSVLNLIFQQANVVGVGNLSKWSSEIVEGELLRVRSFLLSSLFSLLSSLFSLLSSLFSLLSS